MGAIKITAEDLFIVGKIMGSHTSAAGALSSEVEKTISDKGLLKTRAAKRLADIRRLSAKPPSSGVRTARLWLSHGTRAIFGRDGASIPSSHCFGGLGLSTADDASAASLWTRCSLAAASSYCVAAGDDPGPNNRSSKARPCSSLVYGPVATRG